MENDPEKLARLQRIKEAETLLEIEGNPLSAADKEMFAMFEREGWSDEKCRAYILQQIMGPLSAPS